MQKLLYYVNLSSNKILLIRFWPKFNLFINLVAILIKIKSILGNHFLGFCIL